MSDETTIVRDFIRERHEYVNAARATTNPDADYYRWQGHMEARRQLAQKLGLPYESDPEPPAEYWIAARDHKGCIRLNQGKGMHIADADHTRGQVQTWFDMATKEKWRKTYQAALTLIDSENHATEGEK